MITVLTPSYNRAHTLPRLFDSLCAQENLNFEWLVVDDGSSDGTGLLLGKLASEAPFSVRYIHQKNSGKHVAINAGCAIAHGPWILILDSDDALTPDAIHTVVNAIEENKELKIPGLCFRKKYFDGRMIGSVVAMDEKLMMHPTEASNVLRGDLAYVFRRSSLLAHPFPIIKNEKFIPELYVWNKIGDGGKILFYTSKAIYLCDYLSDGYTINFSKNLKRNPRGFLLYYWSQISRERSATRKLKCAIRSFQCLSYAILGKINK